MAISKEGTYLMSVKRASVCHNSEEDYKMTAKPRGPCLIVNNVDFEGELFARRKGSDEDASRFNALYQQLGFQVIMRRNQTADEMRKLFKDVAAECKSEHDALFVFILSHGSEYGIYGTDGMEVYLESEIISCFDNQNCVAMRGKPKVFVIQACRGSFVSIRNELAGSWLGVALAYFIMTYSHERDLLRILNLVANDVIQRQSSNGHTQSIELKLLGWTKNLYFNPGIYS